MRRFAAFVLLVAGCGGGGGSQPSFYDRACPGGPDCQDKGDDVLLAGAAKEKINPTLVETEWQDLNNDGLWEPNEPFTDVNGNGVFDAVWMGGFDNGRAATSIHDDLWARAIALRYNQTTIVFVEIDALGLFKHRMDAIRDAVPASLGIDLIVIGTTHSHETPDTAGAWGATEAKSGIDETYMALIRDQAAKAVMEAVADLKPANLTVAQIKVADPDGTTKNWVHDGRDPVIADTTMSVLRFTKAGDPNTTIATWVNWASHPEYAWSHNHAITADFPYTLRTTVETDGFPGEGLAPLGGMCLYSQSALGALIGPGSPTGGIAVKRADGTTITTESVERSEAGGRDLARFALKALQPGNGAETLLAPPLRFRTKLLVADIENYQFQTAGLIKIYERPLFGYDTTMPFSPTNLPKVRSEINHIEIGPIGLATFPGELAPELWIGGYDGSYAGGAPFIDPTNPAPPDVTKAPPGPYIKDLLLARPGIKYGIGLGLTQDWLGYIIPLYDFKLNPDNPYWTRAVGDHYEETNSIGPHAEEQLIAPLRQLIMTP